MVLRELPRRWLTAALFSGAALQPVEAQPISNDAYRTRRSAVIDRLESKLLIVPSQSGFKYDDQATFLQAANFQYLTGESELVGAVLIVDGKARTSTLFLPPVNRMISRPRPLPGPETARHLGLEAAWPIDSLESWLRGRLAGASGVLVGGSDPRGMAAGPPPMAGAVARWNLYLQSLGWKGTTGPATPVLGPLREIKSPPRWRSSTGSAGPAERRWWPASKRFDPGAASGTPRSR